MLWGEHSSAKHHIGASKLNMVLWREHNSTKNKQANKLQPNIIKEKRFRLNSRRAELNHTLHCKQVVKQTKSDKRPPKSNAAVESSEAQLSIARKACWTGQQLGGGSEGARLNIAFVQVCVSL